MNDKLNSSASPQRGDYRYSLREIVEEVKIERRESEFGRQLVDATEINKMFSKAKRRKKKTAK